jgi:hypothetical protein
VCKWAANVLLAALLLTATAAAAQVRKIGPEFQVNTYTLFSQYLPRVTVLDNEHFLVVWFGGDPSGYLAGVRAQAFDRDAVHDGLEFLVTTAATTDDRTEGAPVVAGSGDGSFVVAWESYYDTDNVDIGAQKYDVDRAQVGTELRVNAPAAGQYAASVATDATGNFVVVWVDGGPFENFKPTIALKRFSAQGLPIADQIVVPNTTSLSFAPSIAMTAAGNFVVAWHQLDRDGDGAGILAQRFESTGQEVGPEFVINTTTTGNQVVPTVATAPNGDFVVVWQSSDGDGDGVFGRTFKMDGTPSSDEFQINTYTTSQQTVPSVAVDGAGGFTALWESNAQDGSERGVFGQRFSAAATRQGGEFRVNTYTSGSQGGSVRRESDVASWSDGDFVTVWTTQDQDGSRRGVFGQRFHFDPTLGPLCGDVVGADLRVSVTDALAILQSAIGLTGCLPCVCDANGSGGITATDALLVLNSSVGLPVTIACPPCA